MPKISPIFSGTCKDFVGITLEICDIFCRCCPWLSVSVDASTLLGWISWRCVKQQLPCHFRICLESWNIWLYRVQLPITYSPISLHSKPLTGRLCAFYQHVTSCQRLPLTDYLLLPGFLLVPVHFLSVFPIIAIIGSFMPDRKWLV